ncbi:hypothetical protein JQ557_07795 [Bradyrhizobium sp. U87765 SZCCT0131]|uniref:hypothetical protein n=1 Tax=unclassified Bradyrhizobium TaxID=2631580 RepID=UPI001BA9A8EA|nr:MULTISPECIES: hypothetical protein [unclassified Bradyrhizobium]MBR1217887.1 hypothetical protein [Bradyrhizobium sp. U87765 SZCCT0131]MBR1261167.1 hypothetical protein [Bradyrhizobium sp. U87765 SZCCT0134]MBR1303385.1 hypothetical protein [Bradyrhizobium sp. U87765 SZCCT0110]MBR1318991.1 hypothetical protein [Bradyrhizobium sp. U87765 SZCCT0109]MBR1347316.1 hypothetical protein [Bradyrhizobium sp. U87765 SZCCT0048]
MNYRKVFLVAAIVLGTVALLVLDGLFIALVRAETSSTILNALIIVAKLVNLFLLWFVFSAVVIISGLGIREAIRATTWGKRALNIVDRGVAAFFLVILPCSVVVGFLSILIAGAAIFALGLFGIHLNQDELINFILIIICVLASGLILFVIRSKQPFIYGLAEVHVGAGSALISIFGKQIAAERLLSALAILAGLYIIVRGIDNIDKALPTDSKLISILGSLYGAMMEEAPPRIQG